MCTKESSDTVLASAVITAYQAALSVSDSGPCILLSVLSLLLLVYAFVGFGNIEDATQTKKEGRSTWSMFLAADRTCFGRRLPLAFFSAAENSSPVFS